jgi:argininosuccinate lyase
LGAIVSPCASLYRTRSRRRAAPTEGCLTLKGTPFTNSVEVGTEAVSPLWPALADGESAVRLMALMLRGVEVDPVRMRDFLARSETTMTALADHLVARHGLSFRSAHEAVGQVLRRLPPGDRSVPAIRQALQETVAEASGRTLALEEDEIARALDPEAAVRAAAFGGGPAPEVVRAQLERLREGLGRLAGHADARRRRLADADLRLDRAADELAGGGSDGADGADSAGMGAAP